MDRAEKREFVTSLHETFQASGTVVVAHYAGLTVAQMNDYRSKMRVAGGTVRVAKNRLAKIALEGTDAAGISNLFEGQTLIAYSSDPVAAATDQASATAASLAGGCRSTKEPRRTCGPRGRRGGSGTGGAWG